MKLRPLDLERMRIILKGEVGTATAEEIIEYFKSNIKQACEFYLRYLSMPHRFKKEQWDNLTEKEREELDDFLRVIDTTDIPDDVECEIYNYNIWLLKLAFKGVLEGD